MTRVAGTQKSVEIGIKLTVPANKAQGALVLLRNTVEAAPAEFEKNLKRTIAPSDYLRLAGAGISGPSVDLYLAVKVGTPQEIREAAGTAQDAVALIDFLINRLGAFNASFDTIPEPGSMEAMNVENLLNDSLSSIFSTQKKTA